MNEETTPIEASLKWTIGKRRQEKFDFIGGEAVKKQIAEGIKKRRVGVLSVGAPARAGAPITLPDGTEVSCPVAFLGIAALIEHRLSHSAAWCFVWSVRGGCASTRLNHGSTLCRLVI